MTTITNETITHQHVELVQAQVRLKEAWGRPVPRVEHSTGTSREPGYGARLAIRKYGDAINKLAEH
jgi:hypothetical protein